MTVRAEFDQYFDKEYLEKIYHNRVIVSGATGIDNLSQRHFWGIQKDQIDVIVRKVLSGNYEFTKYKQKLASKGAGKVPREISIPTIRDRIVLRALCDFLTDHFKDLVEFQLPQNVIKDVKSARSDASYTHFIKLDVQNFYPSVPHSIFKIKLRHLIADKEIRNLVYKAIKTPTVSRPSKSDKLTKAGIPQGLAISNVLAAIFLADLDRKYRRDSRIKFYRYVDDILVFSPEEKVESVTSNIISDFSRLGLKVHDPKVSPEKSRIGKLTDEFDYLGYSFRNNLITVRSGSIEKLRESIVSIFTSYRYSKNRNEKFLEWRLNMRITGCIFENKCMGWLFFFSEINDKELLHSLDNFIMKLARRFNVVINPKRFARSFYEINHKRYTSKYIPNFDEYTDLQKKEVLVSYFQKTGVESMTPDELDLEFRRRISKQVKDLLQDVQNFS
ncbi:MULTISPECIES: reverse transcriptase domain-containing protein [Marinobacter]|uniref:Reverse transcriptase domain-containing protein n=1 Tax=Marinobacter nauticus TaxID=2743 RepID=A0A833NEN8_MARNT|nr:MULTISPECIES: reverse transcriptase domain-containing protein [Marinobacter]KAE8546819.1 hypothetical protein F6453_0499 [Marinobacter nauticus]